MTQTFISHNTPRKRYKITFPKQGRTKQSFKNECDINQIMAKYQKTGAISHFNKHKGDYAFATSHDFSSAMRLITTAQDMFNGLPSTIRNRFANDPAQFLNFVQDSDNEEEMKKLGLVPGQLPDDEQNTPEPKKDPDEKPPVPKKTDTPPKEA